MLNSQENTPLFLYASHIMRGDFSKLQAALNSVDMSQAELARRIGVTRAAVSNWIRGHAVPQLGHVLKIAEILDMSVSEILGDEIVFAETKTERELIETLRALSDADRQQLVRMAHFLAASEKPTE